MDSTYLLRNGAVWTNGAGLLPDSDVLIEGDRVSEVGKGIDPERAGANCTLIDCSNHLVMPGLVNAHTHLYSTLARGLRIPDFAPKSFPEILEGLWWQLDSELDEEAVETSALVGGLEYLKNGVTTLFDHHSSPDFIDGSLDTVKTQVVDRLGLRACLCYEVSDRNGSRVSDQSIQENLRWLDQVDGNDCSRTAGQFGLHASFTLSDETLEKIRAELGSRQVGFHLHCAEGEIDQRDSLKRSGLRVAERLARQGLLNDRTCLAHGVHLTREEMEIIGEAGGMIVHNPQSNMNNGVGIADLTALDDSGVLLGLGNDGFGFDLLDELRSALLLQRLNRRDPSAVGSIEIGELLFQNNYQLVERLFGTKIGQIAPGHQADLLVVDYQRPTPMTTDNIYDHLFHGLAGTDWDLRDAFVGGRPIYRNHDTVGVEEGEIYARSREVARSLWNRLT